LSIKIVGPGAALKSKEEGCRAVILGLREIERMGCWDSNSNYNLQPLVMQGRGVSF